MSLTVKNILTGSGLQQSRCWSVSQFVVRLMPLQPSKKMDLLEDLGMRECDRHTSTVVIGIIIVTAQQNRLNAHPTGMVVGEGTSDCEERESQHEGEEDTSNHFGSEKKWLYLSRP